jgi:phage gp29-like protein
MANGGPIPPPAYPELGKISPPSQSDPAWAPPRDPLASGNVAKTARVILREIPLATVQSSWTVPMVRAALAALPSGQFADPAQLIDAIVGDDRVQAAMGSRAGGLTSQPIKFAASRLPGVDPAAADACLDAWKRVWPKLATEPVLSELQQWSIMLGFCPAQILWDTSEEIWCPYVRVFHPRWTYYHWTLRALVATTMDGSQAVTPGDGHWLLHAPHGEYRGWMRGAVRSIAQPWLIRNLAYRDHARWSERHGFPMTLALTPAAAEEVDKTRFMTSLANAGQETLVEVPQGVDKQFSYGVDLLEAKDGAWQGFTALIQQCESSIVLALLGQNLTTEIKEGSFAAARVHADVRQSFLQSDARALSHTIYTQIARPFAAINFGDPNLAPSTDWDLIPTEDRELSAKVLLEFAQAVFELRRGGKELVSIAKVARSLGIVLDDDDLQDAPPITAGGGEASSGGGPEARRKHRGT